jgi:hypothetical protein
LLQLPLPIYILKDILFYMRAFIANERPLLLAQFIAPPPNASMAKLKAKFKATTAASYSPYHLSRPCAPPAPPSQPRVVLVPLGFTAAFFAALGALGAAALFLNRACPHKNETNVKLQSFHIH